MVVEKTLNTKMIANDALDMLRTGAWKERKYGKGENLHDSEGYLGNGSGIWFYYIPFHERLGNYMIRSDFLRDELKCFNNELIVELTAFRVCERCLSSKIILCSQAHRDCILSYVLQQKYQVFIGDGGGEMRLNHNPTGSRIAIYLPVHALLAEAVARAVLRKVPL